MVESARPEKRELRPKSERVVLAALASFACDPLLMRIMDEKKAAFMASLEEDQDHQQEED